jgi:hypothetical protein
MIAAGALCCNQEYTSESIIIKGAGAILMSIAISVCYALD